MSIHDEILKKITDQAKKIKQYKKKSSSLKDAQYHVFNFFKEVDEINSASSNLDLDIAVSTKPNSILFGLAYANLVENIYRLDMRAQIGVKLSLHWMLELI